MTTLVMVVIGFIRFRCQFVLVMVRQLSQTVLVFLWYEYLGNAKYCGMIVRSELVQMHDGI